MKRKESHTREYSRDPQFSHQASGSLCENPTWKKNLGTNLTLKQSTEELPGCDFSNTEGQGQVQNKTCSGLFQRAIKTSFQRFICSPSNRAPEYSVLVSSVYKHQVSKKLKFLIWVSKQKCPIKSIETVSKITCMQLLLNNIKEIMKPQRWLWKILKQARQKVNF